MLHREITKNKKYKETIKKLQEGLENTKGIEDRHIQERKNQLSNYVKKIK